MEWGKTIWGRGEYEVMVKDDKGCMDTLLIDIGDTTAQTALFTANPIPDGPICISQAEITFVNRSEKCQRLYLGFRRWAYK